MKADHLDHVRAVPKTGRGAGRLTLLAEARVNGDVHDGHASCGSATRASRFLTGLVTSFAAHVPVAAGALR